MITKPILYFIKGTVPTSEEFEKAMEFSNKGPFLEFVSLIDFDLNSTILEASGVAGEVPEGLDFPVLDKFVAIKKIEE